MARYFKEKPEKREPFNKTEYGRSWRAAHPEHTAEYNRRRREKRSTSDSYRAKLAEASRRSALKGKWGITHTELIEWMERQDNRCPICRAPLSWEKRKCYAIDHDHETDTIRGLLCNRCNSGLGMLGDSLANVQRAVEYLEGSTAKSAQGKQG